MYSDYMKPNIHTDRINILNVKIQQEESYIKDLECENQEDLNVILKSNTCMTIVNILTCQIRNRNVTIKTSRNLIIRLQKELDHLQSSGD